MYVCVCHAHSIRKIKFEVFFFFNKKMTVLWAANQWVSLLLNKYEKYA